MDNFGAPSVEIMSVMMVKFQKKKNGNGKRDGNAKGPESMGFNWIRIYTSGTIIIA